MRPTRILVFAKAPVTGRVKTRLIPALGAEGAATLAAEMLVRTIGEAIAAEAGLVELCGDPDPAGPEWAGRLPPGIASSAQGEGDLGARMARAARRTIERGERAVLIGTDCPDLDRMRLRHAIAFLDDHDAIIHPTRDGGYALLGLERFDPSLFADIAWSTPAVAEATMTRIRSLGWSLKVGETLCDIDEPADLL
ncbi:TIGR04282 family arsenosugar biosynthesis glycosyltransferase [Sphingosinicella sp. CPCC 101087]|uniref:TIGR04282 family arsenosugar biosynthesis glycosyltransferase n=1 Tax=Sphingosinicella sp. CPCC 101087 TaxID=2497754 RepID=UPI00101D7568|nr:TIGR04282 family arsenosugar biosynthesis glycosyltransferase [Sphingosinicella sp. CPCC 101087]